MADNMKAGTRLVRAVEAKDEKRLEEFDARAEAITKQALAGDNPSCIAAVLSEKLSVQ